MKRFLALILLLVTFAAMPLAALAQASATPSPESNTKYRFLKVARQLTIGGPYLNAGPSSYVPSILWKGNGATPFDTTIKFTNPAQVNVVTFPDPGGNDSVIYAAAAQTLTGKTFTSPILTGASTGTGTLAYANSASSSVFTFPFANATDTIATLKSSNTFTGALQTFPAVGIAELGTGAGTGKISMGALGQATTFTLPDAGQAADTVATLKAANVFTGATTFSLAQGVGLVGTSQTATIKAVAGLGQATALTVDDPGATTGFIPTLAVAQVANGQLSRADMITETAVTIWRSILRVKNLAGTTLTGSAGAGVFGLSTTATFGSPATLTLLTETANNNTKTDWCEFEFVLPPDYVAGSAINVNVNGSVTIGSGTLSVQTVTCDAFLCAAAGTVGTNLGPIAQNLVNGGSTLAFSITPTGLVAGNKLLIQLQTVLTETSTHAVTANLNDISVTTSVKM